MPRNIQKDIREEKRRREQLLQTGFHLFAAEGIEEVSLQRVAKEADVAISTLFNYYKNKTNFAVAISAYIWGNYWQEVRKSFGEEKLETEDAYEYLEGFCDCILDLYRTNPEVLRFSGRYKTYICGVEASKEQVSEHVDTLDPVSRLFHEKYERAKTDGSIRTDLPAEEILTTMGITMLGMAERYALGIVWVDNGGEHEKELHNVRDMLLQWVKK